MIVVGATSSVVFPSQQPEGTDPCIILGANTHMCACVMESRGFRLVAERGALRLGLTVPVGELN